MEPYTNTPSPDPIVTAAVYNVRDRFGAEGLRDLIALAHEQLRILEASDQPVETPTLSEPRQDTSYDSADTQAWLAYTEADAFGSENSR